MPLPNEMLDSSAKQRAGLDLRSHVIFLVTAALVLWLTMFLDLNRKGQVVLPVLELALPSACSFQRLTGYDCAGCGLTRSFLCISRGQLRQACSFNPAGPLIFALVVAQLPYRMTQILRIRCGQAPLRFPGAAGMLWFVVAALLGQWIVRALGGWIA